MNEKKKRSYAFELIVAIFGGVPWIVGKKIAEWIRFSDSWEMKTVWISALAAAFLVGVSGFKWILATHFLSGRLRDPSGWWAFLLVYGFYTLTVLWGFVLFAYIHSQLRKNVFQAPGSKKKRNISDSSVREGRKVRKPGETYLGKSFWSGKPVVLNEDMRLHHTHVVGSTGSGKTESVLVSFLRQDIADGRGVIIIDAKGDLDLREKIRNMMAKVKRDKDFLYFSLSHPEISHSYNPLRSGSASEIKDKIIGSTEWTEEFYRKRAEEACLTLLSPMISLGMDIHFRSLYRLLTDQKALIELKDKIPESQMREDLNTMISQFGENTKYLSGLISDLALVTKSEFSKLVDVNHPLIDLDSVYEKGEVVYFSLNTQGFEETAKRFGRLILQDIKTFSNRLQTGRTNTQRVFFPIYVDEFSSFVYESFIELLNKARGSKLAIMILHQSMGDLTVKRLSYQQQVIENTNVKIIMRQDDPVSVEILAKLGGSERTLVSTVQTQEQMTGTELTGLGSMREGQVFRIDPDLIRILGKGEAIVLRKFPKHEIDYVKLDYAGGDPVGGDLQPIENPVIPDQPKQKLQDNLMEVRREHTNGQ